AAASRAGAACCCRWEPARWRWSWWRAGWPGCGRTGRPGPGGGGPGAWRWWSAPARRPTARCCSPWGCVRATCAGRAGRYAGLWLASAAILAGSAPGRRLLAPRGVPGTSKQMSRLFRDVAGGSLCPRGSVVCIGAFDGLHLGHRALVRHAVARAHALDVAAVALSFEPLPREFFARANPPPRLTLPRDRIRMLLGHGLDHLGLLRFNAELAA